MNDINSDIIKYKQICSNYKNFIKYKNIIKVNLQKNKNIYNLPYQCFMGSSYLIKNNNMIEIYSYIYFDYSLFFQINEKTSKWISKINIINTEKDDPYNIKYILQGYKQIFFPSELELLISEFINDGFKLFIK